MTVPPARVNVLAPPVPSTVTWLFVAPVAPWTNTSFGIAALALAGEQDRHAVRLAGGQIDRDGVGRLERGLAEDRLGDVVVNLDLAAGEETRSRCRPGSNSREPATGAKPMMTEMSSGPIEAVLPRESETCRVELRRRIQLGAASASR